MPHHLTTRTREPLPASWLVALLVSAPSLAFAGEAAVARSLSPEQLTSLLPELERVCLAWAAEHPQEATGGLLAEPRVRVRYTDASADNSLPGTYDLDVSCTQRGSRDAILRKRTVLLEPTLAADKDLTKEQLEARNRLAEMMPELRAACESWAVHNDRDTRTNPLPEPTVLPDWSMLPEGSQNGGAFEVYASCTEEGRRDVVLQRRTEGTHWEWHDPVIDFVDRQYFAWSPQKVTRRYAAGPEARRGDPTWVLFAARAAPNLYLPQRVHQQANGKTTVTSVFFTFGLHLRMLLDDSSPVAPPSFMPKLTLQRLYFMPTAWGRLDEEDAQRAQENHLAPRQFLHRWMWGWQVSAGHHSNGQEGCFYGNEVGFDGENCTAPDPNLPAYPPNEYNGSYSTNYLSGTFLLRNIFGIDYGGDVASTWFATIGYERHFEGEMGGLDPRQGVYTGYDRLLFSSGIEYGGPAWFGLGGRRIAEVALEWSPDADEANFAATFTAKWRKANRGFGLFGSVRVGYDDYNILFDHNEIRVHLGFSFDQNLYRNVTEM